MSNLINRRGRDERRALLRACRRHVESGGVVLIQRYDPRSGLDPAPPAEHRFGVTIAVSDLRREGQSCSYTVDYDAGEQGHWGFRAEEARILDDEELRRSSPRSAFASTGGSTPIAAGSPPSRQTDAISTEPTAKEITQ